MARRISLEITGDSRSLERAFARSSRAAKGFERSMTLTSGSLGRSLAQFGLAAGGIAAVSSAIRGAFGELSESRKVAAQTGAVLASTGGVAGVTAAHVDELAKSLMRLTGVDDEAIGSAENLLLTFTNLRNVAGEGNDIFDQATRAVVDMSAVMGDLESNSVRIGKALQDPIRGAAALRRVGVQLTTAQERQIGTLVRSNRMLEAQKIILGELRREFGGQAEAVGRTQPWNLLRETLRNLSAEIVNNLLPTIIPLIDRIQGWLDNPANTTRLVQGFQDATQWVGRLADRVGDVIDALGGWRQALTIAVGLWAGFRIAGVTSAVTVQTANVVAAGVTASAWRAALISTGWGAFAIAAGLAAAYVVTHWTKVKVFFQKLWLELRAGAIQGALWIVEPFSHLPERFGQWARDAKVELLAEMDGLRADFRSLGADSAEAFGTGWKSHFPDVGPGMTLDIPTGEARGGAVAPGGFDPVTAAKDAAAKAAAAATRRREEAARREALRQAAAEALQRRQFTQLGLAPTGEARVASESVLRRRLGTLSSAVRGTALDTKAWRAQMTRIRNVLKTDFGKLTRQTRAWIENFFNETRRSMDDGSKEVRKVKLLRISSGEFVRGLGLAPGDAARVAARYAGLSAGGFHPGTRSLAFSGGGVTMTGTVNFYGVQNVSQLEEELQKRTKSRRRNRRGVVAP